MLRNDSSPYSEELILSIPKIKDTEFKREIEEIESPLSEAEKLSYAAIRNAILSIDKFSSIYYEINYFHHYKSKVLKILEASIMAIKFFTNFALPELDKMIGVLTNVINSIKDNRITIEEFYNTIYDSMFSSECITHLFKQIDDALLSSKINMDEHFAATTLIKHLSKIKSEIAMHAIEEKNISHKIKSSPESHIDLALEHFLNKSVLKDYLIKMTRDAIKKYSPSHGNKVSALRNFEAEMNTLELLKLKDLLKIINIYYNLLPEELQNALNEAAIIKYLKNVTFMKLDEEKAISHYQEKISWSENEKKNLGTIAYKTSLITISNMRKYSSCLSTEKNQLPYQNDFILLNHIIEISCKSSKKYSLNVLTFYMLHLKFLYQKSTLQSDKNVFMLVLSIEKFLSTENFKSNETLYYVAESILNLLLIVTDPTLTVSIIHGDHRQRYKLTFPYDNAEKLELTNKTIPPLLWKIYANYSKAMANESHQYSADPTRVKLQDDLQNKENECYNKINKQLHSFLNKEHEIKPLSEQLHKVSALYFLKNKIISDKLHSYEDLKNEFIALFGTRLLQSRGFIKSHINSENRLSYSYLHQMIERISTLPEPNKVDHKAVEAYKSKLKIFSLSSPEKRKNLDRYHYKKQKF